MRLCRVKFIPSVINSGYVQDSQRYALWASPTVSHRGDENERRPLFAGSRPQKNTACGLVRRGRPEAFLARQVPTNGRRKTVAKTDSRGWRPAVIFRHSLAEYDGVFLRATNHGSFPGFKCGNSSSSLATMRFCSANGGRGIRIALSLDAFIPATVVPV